MRLTRASLVEILRRAPAKSQQAMLLNPHEYAIALIQSIKTHLTEQLINGIRYEPINRWYEMTQFETSIESWQEHLEPAQKSIYDQVIYDSEIERSFMQQMERKAEVTLYVKLPTWFTVPTPIGTYNPDWAIVWQERDIHGQPTGNPTLYLVRETKGSATPTLRPEEQHKITCGAKHFNQLGVDYKVITNAEELP